MQTPDKNISAFKEHAGQCWHNYHSRVANLTGANSPADIFLRGKCPSCCCPSNTKCRNQNC